MEAIANRPPQVEHAPFDPAPLLANLDRAEQEWQSEGLPIAQHQKEIRDLFRRENSILLEADPGSGKSTVAPILFLHELLLDNPEAKVIVTQPRRIATRSIPEYVGQKIGHDFVDYQYKGHPFERTKINSRLHFVVEQTLLNTLVEDEMLSGYDTVMIDEVHERSAEIDILVPLLKRAQRLRKEQRRKPLKVVLASGTMDKKLLSDYFEGIQHKHIEGKTYPVAEKFSDRDIPIDELPQAAAKQAADLLIGEKEKGDILIFMPGKLEIDQTEAEIHKLITDPHVEVVRIMGGDQEGDPYKKIKDNPGNKQRIYISTSAGEVAITIPITTVIDSGLMREMIYDPETQVETLETMQHTKANWRQRRGRAGRIQPGKAYALFTEASLNGRAETQQAEFLRSELTPQILKMKAIGITDVHNFDYIEHPGKERIDYAIASLQQLGALDKNGRLTVIGKEMAELDEEPLFARILIEAKRRNCLDEVTLLIGLMKKKGKLFNFDRRHENFQTKYREYIDPKSDFLTVLNVWNDYIDAQKARKEFDLERKGINIATLKIANRERREMLHDSFFENKRVTNEKFDLTPKKTEAISLSLMAGLIPRLLTRENNGTYKFQSGTSSGIRLDSTSVLMAGSPEKILCGKIHSTKKHTTQTFALMNMVYDQEKALSAFDYLQDFVTSPVVEQVSTQAVAPTPEASIVPEAGETSATNLSQTSALSNELAALQDQISKQPVLSRPVQPTTPEPVKRTLRAKIKIALTDLWRKIRKFFTGK